MKKFSGSISGLILGVFAIFGAFFIEGGSFKSLFLLPALIIVFGGTFSAVIIGSGFKQFKKIKKLTRIAYSRVDYDSFKIINKFSEFSIITRKEGLLSLEKRLDEIDFYFMQKLLRLLIDGMTADDIINIATLEMKSMQERHFSNIQLFTKMGGYAPTMGIIGTVMGLIMTLANADSDPSLLIKSIATAFIATLWGVFSANILWLPISDKLKKCHSEEIHMMQLSLEGILSLQNGEIPMLVKAKLLSMLPQEEQKDLMIL